VALLSGCASPNPYDNQGQASAPGMSKTAKYGGLGALAGAVAGAAIDHNNRGKGALIGAAVGGASAAGYGYYADQQKKNCAPAWPTPALKCSARAIRSTDHAGQHHVRHRFGEHRPSFYQPLNNLAGSLKSSTRTRSRSSVTPTAPAAASTTWTCPSVVRRAWQPT
jgi:hypothetical protein